MKYFIAFLFFSIATLSYSQTVEKTQQPQIIVYGVDDCHFCHDSRALLDKNNIKYIFHDVDIDVDKRNEMIQGLKSSSIDLKNLNMPVIKKSGEYLINSGDFDLFLEKLIPFVKDDVSKS